MKPLLQIAALAVAAFAIACPARADVDETLRREPYAVSGSTEAEVRADINAKRRGNYDATARWHIRWRYVYRTLDTGCAFARVTTSLELTMVEPSLRSPDPVLQKSFDDYIARLRIHEDGHADLARATARRVNATLLPMKAATCFELGRLANEAAHAIVAEGNSEQAAYDARTDHGATQGARWPRNTVSTPPDRSQYQTPDMHPPAPSQD